MNYILQVNNAIKYYSNGTVTTKALNGVTFDVEQGEFVAVMGASGSGKSTLLNVISTIEPLSGGDIRIDNISLASLREKDLAEFRRNKLGFIFQEYNLLDTLTVEENISLPLNLQKASVANTEREVARVAAALGVTAQLKKFPRELSGGERQRAACARAVVTNPALILADEPTGALDSRNSRLLMEQFGVINKDFKATILMVTHDAMMGSYANRVLFLRDGKIYSELLRGEKERKDFYRDILAVTASLGGGTDAL